MTASFVLQMLAVADASPGAFGSLDTMKGPDFLKLYFVWFLATWIGVLMLRKHGFDTPSTTIVGVVLFEALGVGRYLLGSAHGMHNWLFLFLMMGGGMFFFVLRAHHFDQSGGGGWSGCSSGGGCGSSSCGGGGCGGGGCGGCGGS